MKIPPFPFCYCWQGNCHFDQRFELERECVSLCGLLVCMEKSLFEIQALVSKSTLHMGNFWCSSLTGPWIRVMIAFNGWGTLFLFFLSYEVFCREYGLRNQFFSPFTYL